MNRLLICIVIILTSIIVEIKGENKYNVSYADLDTCQEFTTEGYIYRNYYKIEELKKRPNADEMVHIRLYIQAAKDAHILLTPMENPPLDMPVYEIVLGAGGNSFSEIRRRRKNTPLFTVRRSNILSPIEVLPVLIVIRKNGSIEVTIANQTEPFMKVIDPQLLPVQYLGLSSWGSMAIKFFYDCHFGSEYADNLEKMSASRTATEQLQDVLLRRYDVQVIPDDLTFVSLGLSILRYSFDTRQSALKTRAMFRMVWHDPKLVWNPDEFGNVRSLTLQSEKPLIWTPYIFLHNGKGDHFAALPLRLIVHVQSNGSVSVESKEIDFETWCTDIGQHPSRMWPYDRLTCDLKLGMVHPTVHAIPVDRDFHKIVNPNTDHGEWFIDQVILAANGTVDIDNWSTTGDPDVDDVAAIPIDLTYKLTLKRNSALLVRLFVSPLIVCHILMMVSFWSDGPSRAGLTLCSQLVSAFMLAVQLDYAPNSYVPTLVRFYVVTQIMAWLAIVAFVIDRCLDEYATDYWKAPIWITRCLASDHLRCAFRLENVNILNHTETNICTDMRRIIDRLAFIAFATVFAIGLTIGI